MRDPRITVLLIASCMLLVSCKCARGDLEEVFSRGPTLDEVGGLRLEYSIDEAAVIRREARDLGREPTEEEAREALDAALEGSIEAVRTRLDAIENPSACVYLRGDRVVVEIPGSEPDDADRIRNIVTPEGRLEFLVVDDGGSTWIRDLEGSLPAGIELREETPGIVRRGGTGWYLASPTRAPLETHLATLSPPTNHVLYLGRDDADVPGPTAPGWRSWYLLEPGDAGRLTGRHVEDAQVEWDDYTQSPYVAVELTKQGRMIFGDLTAACVDGRLAICLDGVVLVAPLVREPITGGTLRIDLGIDASRGEKLRETQDLAAVLRAGALPAPLVLETEIQVGPSKK